MNVKRKVPLRRIAEAAGVSVSTVSLVLNGHGAEKRIAPATQEKIRKITALLQKETAQEPVPFSPVPTLYRIAVFYVNDCNDLPLHAFDRGISQYCAASPLPIDYVYHPYHSNALSGYRFLFSPAYYDGIIVTTPYGGDISFLCENRFPIPVVLYNCQINGYTSVGRDDFGVGRRAAEILLRHGKKRIALITPSARNRGMSLRVAGFRDCLESAGFPSEHFFMFEGNSKDFAGGHLAVTSLLASGARPDAIYLVNDLMTAGALDCLSRSGISVPDDVELLSYGNTDAPSLVPSVTSFDPRAGELACACIESLFAEIRRETAPGRYFCFPARCLWRDSCPRTPQDEQFDEESPERSGIEKTNML